MDLNQGIEDIQLVTPTLSTLGKTLSDMIIEVEGVRERVCLGQEEQQIIGYRIKRVEIQFKKVIGLNLEIGANVLALMKNVSTQGGIGAERNGLDPTSIKTALVDILPAMNCGDSIEPRL